MRAYVHILARLVAYWGHLPPEAIATVMFAVPVIVGILAGLPYVLDLVAGGVVSWWAIGIFKAHVWPDVPSEHRRLLLALRDLALLKKSGEDPRRLPGMRVTILPHAADRMEQFSISVADVYRVMSDPVEEGQANLGRLYVQRIIANRKIRVVYNSGAEDERIVVTVMLRRK